MRNLYTSLCLGMICFISCQSKNQDSALLQDRDLKRIVLVGGSLISSMENFGFFESAMYTAHPDKEISFRNIGWPADDVYGQARSQFGSAQNTRSWQPPTAEEGFGSKVLEQHIEEANPTTLIIGYGNEAAFTQDQDDFELFTSGYARLLDIVESKNIKLVLLSPYKHETESPIQEEWLLKARNFIAKQAEDGGHQFIDLFNLYSDNESENKYTDNGIKLNKLGYKKLSEKILSELNIAPDPKFSLQLNSDNNIESCQNCEVSNWVKTVNGVSFNLRPKALYYNGDIISDGSMAVFINGDLVTKHQDSLSSFALNNDSLQYAQLIETIKEKNRLHRYRLRPLNEAYIYLFRRHEMGHLAYEMDELADLVAEKEREINQLIKQQDYYVELETIKPWQSPKDYPEDEVPAFIPEPNIENELEAFTVANGFEVNLFASDPMIANPINVNWDTKGRAWVATSSTYPHIVPGREPNDKIVILEDTDQDGVADKHTVFAENLLVPHSVMPVKGGAYVLATTELLFLPDYDGDDIADDRLVVIDGFGNADIHHTIHGFRWMPWGDLHFTQSIYINSFVETAFGPRVLNGSGTWSLRPETERLEIFCRGLVNPWGYAIDEWGQAFATDGAGASGINYVFPESAHATAVGASSVLSGLNSGTPKNTAAEVIYSSHFPNDWQGTIITNDFRANRTVRYKVVPEKSGYQSEEIQTLLKSDHRSYRPVDSKIGLDGALYVVDWYNPIIDHGEVDFHHPIRDKTHGRLWRITNKNKPVLKYTNISDSDLTNLLRLLKSPEQFTRLQANRSFVDQDGDPQLVKQWISRLNKSDRNYERHRLEGLWLLAALNHYDETILKATLNSSKPQVRAAAVRMIAHYQKQDQLASTLKNLVNDNHPQVRLEVIHALREMNSLAASEMIMKLRKHPIDDNIEFASQLTIKQLSDKWMPGFEKGNKLFDGDVNDQLYALLTIDGPSASTHIANLVKDESLTDDSKEKAWMEMAKYGNAKMQTSVLQKAKDENNLKLLRALSNAPESGHQGLNSQDLLSDIIKHKESSFRIEGMKIAGKWKVDALANEILNVIQDSTRQNEELEALRSLAALGKLDDVKSIAKKNENESLRTAACAVWIEEQPDEAANFSVDLFSEIEDVDNANLLFTTFRRMEEGPKILEKALTNKTIPEKIASVGLKMVQTSGLNLKALEAVIRKAGSINPIGNKLSAAEKEALIAEAKESGSRHHGREIYRRQELLCATCHKVNNIGGLAGPDLTTLGSYMTPNSILESLLNPSKDVKQGYETVILTRKSGEVLSGLLHRKTNNATLIRSANGEIVEVPSVDIESVDVSPISLMPAGLTATLHKDELKDLLSYLVNLGVNS